MKPRICQQKWQLEHHNVSNYYSSVPIISTIYGENCIFLFSLNQLRPKVHSKLYERNPEMWESPNLGKRPIPGVFACKSIFLFLSGWEQEEEPIPGQAPLRPQPSDLERHGERLQLGLHQRVDGHRPRPEEPLLHRGPGPSRQHGGRLLANDLGTGQLIKKWPALGSWSIIAL